MPFPRREYKIVGIEASPRRGKKYRAHLEHKRTRRRVVVDFGAVGYSQYRDSTGLALYADDDHLDETRRARFQTRFRGRYDPSCYDATWFSWHYLW